jgi:formamidopyrimidine-DNA glycosylase
VPELPDITVYIEALDERIVGRRLERCTIRSPALLRTAEPPVDAVIGAEAVALRRLGKRIAIGFANDHWLVFHLMIAGRFQWRSDWPKSITRIMSALFGFDSGTLVLTEAGTQKRAALHVVRGEAALAAHDPGGIEIASTTHDAFCEVLERGNHTLKRTLTDPRNFSGIGNAYSDEILHRARLSPVMLTSRLSVDDKRRLFAATRAVLGEWTERLRAENAGRFPAKVTAFHERMAVHGRYRLPCPVCGTAVQRIRYATNETNYCPRCQTGGRLLADRSLSRLLKADWPRTVEAWESGVNARQR